MRVDACRTMRAHGRPWTHVAAVARNNANYADIAWYCAILCAVAAKITQHHAQIEPSSFVRKGTCVHVRGCNQCECRHRNQRLLRAQCEWGFTLFVSFCLVLPCMAACCYVHCHYVFLHWFLVSFFSLANLGGSLADQSLPHVRRWSKFTDIRNRFGEFPPEKKKKKLAAHKHPNFGEISDNFATYLHNATIVNQKLVLQTTVSPFKFWFGEK